MDKMLRIGDDCTASSCCLPQFGEISHRIYVSQMNVDVEDDVAESAEHNCPTGHGISVARQLEPGNYTGCRLLVETTTLKEPNENLKVGEDDVNTGEGQGAWNGKAGK